MVKHIVEDAVRDLGAITVSVPPPLVSTRTRKPRTALLRNRHIRKEGKVACDRTMWIGGKLITGCGRVFATKRGYDLHMDDVAGTFADTKRWPNHCLDAILPEDLRDTR